MQQKRLPQSSCASVSFLLPNLSSCLQRRVRSNFGGGSEGGGVLHFEVDQTSQQSSQYISRYNTEGVPFTSEKTKIVFM